MDITNLTRSIEEATASIARTELLGEQERKELLTACEKLTESLKKPHETVLEISTMSFKPAILRLGQDMHLYEVAAAAPDKTISLADLAAESNSDPVLLIRILRILVGMSIFTEQANHIYSLTPLGACFLPGSPFYSWILIDETNQQSIANITSYFSTRGYKNPSNVRDTPFNHAFKTDLTFFDWLSAHPAMGSAFNHVMQFAKMLRGPDWYEFFPVAEKLFSHPSTPLRSPTIIDIGGGTGSDLINFKKKHPNYPGRIILEDLPKVIADADSAVLHAVGVEIVAHSFLDPQPDACHGATAYIIKNCLHDWPDAEAARILTHIAVAMDEHSTLLVCETSLTEQGVPFMNAVFDWAMMIQFAGLDRTERQWRELFANAGLHVKEIWKSPVAEFTVVFEIVKG